VEAGNLLPGLTRGIRRAVAERDGDGVKRWPPGVAGVAAPPGFRELISQAVRPFVSDPASYVRAIGFAPLSLDCLFLFSLRPLSKMQKTYWSSLTPSIANRYLIWT